MTVLTNSVLNSVQTEILLRSPLIKVTFKLKYGLWRFMTLLWAFNARILDQ